MSRRRRFAGTLDDFTVARLVSEARTVFGPDGQRFWLSATSNASSVGPRC